MMIRLNNDYSEGCHPSILLRLNEMNLEQNPGYGTDTHCAEAADAVRKAFACPDADVHFLVGGTKMGALFGEAIVINHPALKKHFRHMMKHQGGLLAKGWLLGVQFSALMADGLYFQLGQKAVKQAMRIRIALLEKGIPLHVDSPTNQLFPIFSDEQVEALEEDFALEFQERVDESHVALRVCTSWATPERNVTAFIEKINKL